MVAVKFSSVSVGSHVSMTPGGNFIYEVKPNRIIVCVKAPESHWDELGGEYEIGPDEEVYIREI